MWYAILLLGRYLVRDNGQFCIELHRITVDDLAIMSFRYLDCKLSAVVSMKAKLSIDDLFYLRFASSCCADDRNERIFRRDSSHVAGLSDEAQRAQHQGDTIRSCLPAIRYESKVDEQVTEHKVDN
jgi:hypothetical protein